MIIQRRALAADQFTQVPNTLIRHPHLSLKAKGLWSWMASHRPGWHTSIRRMAEALGIGPDAVRTGIDELIEHGWVVRSDRQMKGEGGKFGGYVYTLCEVLETEPDDPRLDYPYMDEPVPADPVTAEPYMAEPQPADPTPKNTTTKNTNVQRRSGEEEGGSPQAGNSLGRVAERAAPPSPSAALDEPRCARHAGLADPPPCHGCRVAREAVEATRPPELPPRVGLTQDEVRSIAARREREKSPDHHRHVDALRRRMGWSGPDPRAS